MGFLKIFLLLVHVLIPARISVIYEGNVIQEMIGGIIYVIPLLLAGLIYLSYRFSEKNKVFLFGLLFFLITVSPAIAIGKYGGVGVFIGDRYTYAPMLGLLMIFVVLFYLIPVRSNQWRIGLLSALSVIYFILSFKAIGVWKNAETLWTNAIEKTVCSAPAYNGRGVYYLDVSNEKDKALEDFNQSLRCDSTHARASYNRGLILQDKNRIAEALTDYNRAIRLNPVYVEAFVNRGNIFRDQKNYEQGLADYNRAIQLSPEFPKAYFNRGGLFLNQKMYDNAIQDYSMAIAIDPTYAKAYYNRGLCLYNTNAKEEACENFTLSAEYGYKAAVKVIQEYCQ
jgi:tetratricopeptide (TPR) repeat protein